MVILYIYYLDLITSPKLKMILITEKICVFSAGLCSKLESADLSHSAVTGFEDVLLTRLIKLFI